MRRRSRVGDENLLSVGEMNHRWGLITSAFLATMAAKISCFSRSGIAEPRVRMNLRPGNLPSPFHAGDRASSRSRLPRRKSLARSTDSPKIRFNLSDTGRYPAGTGREGACLPWVGSGSSASSSSC
jgi:hypothetical protein